MKNKPTKTTSRFALRLPHHLFSRLAILGGIVVICSGAQAQNLFVTGTDASGNGAIFEFTPAGVQSTFVSALSSPGALAFDRAGNLFVADSNAASGGTIYKFSPDGTRSTFALGLSNPEALAFDRAGNLFVADGGFVPGGVIYKFTPEGARSIFVSGFSGFLAFDSAGNLFVAGWSNDGINPTGKIYKFTPDGVRSTFASGFIIAGGLAFDRAGNLFLADVGDFIDGVGAALYKFTPTGAKHTVVSWAKNFIAPESGLAIDSVDNLYVPAYYLTSAVTSGDAIFKFNRRGGRTIFATPGGYFGLAFQPIQTTPTPTPTPTPTSTPTPTPTPTHTPTPTPTPTATPTATATPTPSGTVSKPFIAPGSGTYSGSITVHIYCGTSGATIHYTTDGSTPTAASPIYPFGGFVLSTKGAQKVKAIGTKSGMNDSSVASASYTIN